MLIWEFEDLHFTWHIFFPDAPSGAELCLPRGLPASPAGELLSHNCALLGLLLLVCCPWSLSTLHVLPLQGCPYLQACETAPIVWEKRLSVSCVSLQYKRCGELGNLNTFSASPYLQLGHVIRKRPDLGVCHFPWIIPKEKLSPCSLCHSQTPATVPLKTELFASTVVGTTASAFTPVPLVVLELLATPCHGLFKRFWKLAYLNSFVRFSFLKDCVILWCFLPASASHPFYPGLPDSLRNLLVLACSDATALLKWRFASAGPIPALCISCFLRGAIALNKEGQIQSLFCKA